MPPNQPVHARDRHVVHGGVHVPVQAVPGAGWPPLSVLAPHSQCACPPQPLQPRCMAAALLLLAKGPDIIACAPPRRAARDPNDAGAA